MDDTENTPDPAVARSSGRVDLQVAGPGRWAAAARASGQPVTPFADHGWLSLAARLTGTDFLPLVVVADGADVGVAAWLARRRGPLSTVNALPFPYAGPLVPPELIPATLAALRRRARRHGVVRYEFGFSPTTDTGSVDLAEAGFDVTCDGTYLLDTARDVEAIEAGLSRSCRKSLRKVERDGVEIRSAVDGGTLAAVLDAAYGARGLDPGLGGGFPVTPAELASTGVGVHWTVAVQDGVELGSLLAVSSPEVAHLWLGGILPEHRATRANVTLYWDAICWAAESGVPVVDFIGIPDEGIGTFKSQFGGTVHQYPRLTGSVPGLDLVQGLRRRVAARTGR